ncbi:MAG: GNAT family N-acetyltransferase [Oligoflexia bacterium]|nr:GNAT family N-acetyltransferase [Oligoflexia bacterium]MBF0365872.1 GNAT family N-acetyltransferase [Oligoflexia bacterium]
MNKFLALPAQNTKATKSIDDDKTEHLTRKIFKIEWRNYFPDNDKFFEEYGFRVGGELEALAFLKRSQQNAIGNNFFYNSSNEYKSDYYKYVIDHFVFTYRDEIIGYLSGNVYDWGSYYLRYCLIEKAHRGKNLFEAAAKRVIEILEQHQVERIEAHISVNNQKQMIRLCRMGFSVSGTVATDRWGVLTSLTKFNNNKANEVFNTQFCL